jgi:hypothetical protein
MKNETNTAQENVTVSRDQKGETAHEAESRKVRGTVWKNFSQRSGKHYYKVSIRRVEFDADGSAYLANSFWPEDLKDVASVATGCRIWLQDNTEALAEQRKWKKEKMNRSKKPKAASTDSPESQE